MKLGKDITHPICLPLFYAGVPLTLLPAPQIGKTEADGAIALMKMVILEFKMSTIS